MNAQQREALTECVPNLAGIATVIRSLDTMFGPAFDKREQDGIAVLAAEIDAIVEGVKRLLGPVDDTVSS